MDEEFKTAFNALDGAVTGFLDDGKKRIKGLEERQDRLETAFKRAPSSRELVEGKANKDPLVTKALNDFARRGDNQSLAAFSQTCPEMKGMSVISDPDGGYTVIPQMAEAIYTIAPTVDPIRSIAGRVEISSDAWEELLDRGTLASGWSEEMGSRSETDTPQLEKFRVPVHEHYTMPKATQKVLDDSKYNIEEWLNQKIATGFALTEASVFVTGDGVGKPRGFTNYSYGTAGDSSRGWGTLQSVPTGVAAALGTSAAAGLAYTDPFDQVIGQMRPMYLPQCRWLMSSVTKAEIAKLKDTTGRSLVFDDLQSGQPASIRGYPITIVEGMDAIGTNTYPIAFANMQEGYKIVDRMGVSLLRDPFSAKPHVLFYARKRVGGDVRNFEAIKFIKTRTGA